MFSASTGVCVHNFVMLFTCYDLSNGGLNRFDQVVAVVTLISSGGFLTVPPRVQALSSF